MELKVKNKVIDIKFDYGMMFKVQKKLGSVNQETGEKNKDGVGVLFNGIINRYDDSLAELIVLASSKFVTKGVTEEDAIKAIENWIDEHDADSTESLFEEIQQEMVDSGFFKEKISKYIENLETAVEFMKGQDNVNELQIQATEKMIGNMQNALS